MKKIFLLSIILLFSCLAINVEAADLHYHKKDADKSNTQYDRAPVRIPVEVEYDQATRQVVITSNGEVDATVTIYDKDGSILYYSPSVDGSYTIPVGYEGLVTIMLDSRDWYATAKIMVTN